MRGTGTPEMENGFVLMPAVYSKTLKSEMSVST